MSRHLYPARAMPTVFHSRSCQPRIALLRCWPSPPLGAHRPRPWARISNAAAGSPSYAITAIAPTIRGPTPPPGHSRHGYQKIFRAAASRRAISVANISRTNQRIFLPAAAASFCSAVAKSPLTRIVKCCSFMVCPLMRTNPCLGTLQRTAIETPRATRKDW